MYSYLARDGTLMVYVWSFLMIALDYPTEDSNKFLELYL